MFPPCTCTPRAPSMAGIRSLSAPACAEPNVATSSRPTRSMRERLPREPTRGCSKLCLPGEVESVRLPGEVEDFRLREGLMLMVCLGSWARKESPVRLWKERGELRLCLASLKLTRFSGPVAPFNVTLRANADRGGSRSASGGCCASSASSAPSSTSPGSDPSWSITSTPARRSSPSSADSLFAIVSALWRKLPARLLSAPSPAESNCEPARFLGDQMPLLVFVSARCSSTHSLYCLCRNSLPNSKKPFLLCFSGQHRVSWRHSWPSKFGQWRDFST
mmetsp:Transcript_41975/g.130717  ORF Transcript_41975/g.130717 Transcript_41975/m.130717 type:complete len:277 (-) Transcript_41975:2227-3057(-)